MDHRTDRDNKVDSSNGPSLTEKLTIFKHRTSMTEITKLQIKNTSDHD